LFALFMASPLQNMSHTAMIAHLNGWGAGQTAGEKVLMANEARYRHAVPDVWRPLHLYEAKGLES
jgi:hypothetical protein